MTRFPPRPSTHRPTSVDVGAPLTVLYSFPHPVGAPGIGWTAWNQVTELVAAGHRVHLVTTSLERPVAGLASLTTTLAVAGVRVPHRALGRERAFRHHDRVAARAVTRLADTLDVVHAWPAACLATLGAAREAGLPAVREVPNTHTAHAFAVVAAECARLGVAMPPRLAHAGDPRKLRLEEAEYEAATALLVPSEPVRRSFLDRGAAPERLLRHRYGYRPGGAPPPRQYDPARPLRAVFLGRGEPRKGLHHALAAWAASGASREGRLVVHGDLGLVPQYRAVLEPLVTAGVDVRPFTANVPGALAAADVLLLPTVEEGSALVTYEAQAAGVVPLVSTAAGALLDHGVHGLLHEPGDVATLAAHLDLLARDRVRLRRLSEAAAAHAPELTWQAAGGELVAAYRAAATLPRRGSRVRAA
ncbi:glycosyltransferase family 4 protein [Xylanimonas ulmi]|uniref:Glycosyltransferase involved in cell wall biosynthesis n=1 Tax=Xylanimonas ulmi TaxID=228973 RepID=A0A4Q7M3V5_9MICO|nr:glycosyltransferase family 4 protein [Xylanibacterium ulmi]RZS62616.1 glycosyltransferase involved in cell wall biosynthesis [Xylanibacterium ulmi]